MAANEAQRRQWNDAAQVRMWPRRERITSEITPDLLARLAPRAGERLLEIGSGGGLAAIAAAKAVGPTGVVQGFDISEGLVEMSRGRAQKAGATNVSFSAGDAQSDAIPGGPYDAAFSQFGVMFFEDPPAAFANIRSALAPGARLVFACWQAAARNPWLPCMVLAPFLAAPPAPPAGRFPPPSPFVFADPDYTRGILMEAGFEQVSIEPVEYDRVVPDDTIFDARGEPLAGVPEERWGEAYDALERLAASLRDGDGMIKLPLRMQFVRARSAV